MNTYGIRNSGQPSIGTAPQTVKPNSGERDKFMELLLLQMKSQDPMNPMDSSQMFAQMSQLSTLEQLWSIHDLLADSVIGDQLAQGSSLIGRHVEANSLSAGQVSGLVEGVRMESGKVWIQVADAEVLMNEITSVQ